MSTAVANPSSSTPPAARAGASNAMSKPGADVALIVSNVYKTYRLGRVDVPVLRGVDLTVRQSEFVAILGASGSGKSTLLHLIGGLDRPDKPKAKSAPPTPKPNIAYQGRDITGMSARTLDRYRAQDAGFVFQFYHLLPELSVLQNVVIAGMVRWGWAYSARASQCKKQAAELLDHVGLSHRLRHKPTELSGGERQRVAIARALINQPSLLLADEPTGNLDRATGDTILDMILKIRRERNLTMLVVTHDEQTAARADRVVRLTDGKVASS